MSSSAIRISLINANTSTSMTEVMAAAAHQVAAPGTVVAAHTPAMGPPSIESHYDEALAVPGILRTILDLETDPASRPHGYIIGCFGDPGLDAAREVASGPVVGIAQAGMHAAALLGRSFSVVTTLSRTSGRAIDLARTYGFGEICAGVHACDIAPLELETNPDAAKVIADLCVEVLAKDQSESIVLGCAGMADLCQQLSADLGVPVIDGVSAAVTMVEGLARMGLSTGRTGHGGEFDAPIPKQMVGAMAEFSLN